MSDAFIVDVAPAAPGQLGGEDLPRIGIYLADTLAAPESGTLPVMRKIIIEHGSVLLLCGSDPAVTDGTAAGSGLVRELCCSPGSLLPWKDGVLFVAGYRNEQIWFSDGTLAGTNPLTEPMEVVEDPLQGAVGDPAQDPGREAALREETPLASWIITASSGCGWA